MMRSKMHKFLAFVVLSPLIVCGCSSPPKDPSLDPKAAIVPPNKVHPVTLEMENNAEKSATKAAPSLDAKDQNGRARTLADLSQGNPMLLYFINKECPCCVQAEPVIERLGKAFAGKVTIVGVIDADPSQAKVWATKNEANYPILADPSKAIIRAYGVMAGVYMIVIDKNLRIDKVYPGYSKASLKELASRLSRLSNEPDKPIDFGDAPDKLTTGCAL